MQLGPTVSRLLTSRERLSARVELALQTQVSRAPSVACLNPPTCYDPARRNAKSLAALGVTGEFRARRGLGSSWYIVASADLSAVRWETSGSRVATATGAGVGWEIAAYGGRNRVEVRLDRLHDSVAHMDGGRLMLSRVW